MNLPSSPLRDGERGDTGPRRPQVEEPERIRRLERWNAALPGLAGLKRSLSLPIKEWRVRKSEGGRVVSR